LGVSVTFYRLTYQTQRRSCDQLLPVHYFGKNNARK
jgi:hypothetical protein